MKCSRPTRERGSISTAILGRLGGTQNVPGVSSLPRVSGHLNLTPLSRRRSRTPPRWRRDPQPQAHTRIPRHPQTLPRFRRSSHPQSSVHARMGFHTRTRTNLQTIRRSQGNPQSPLGVHTRTAFHTRTRTNSRMPPEGRAPSVATQRSSADGISYAYAYAYGDKTTPSPVA